MILINPSQATAEKAEELGLSAKVLSANSDHPVVGFDVNDIISVSAARVLTSVYRYDSDTGIVIWTGYHSKSEYQTEVGEVVCDPTWFTRAIEANFIRDLEVDYVGSRPVTEWKVKLAPFRSRYPEHNWINQIVLAVLCLYTDKSLTGEQMLKALLARHLKVGTWKVTRLYDTKGISFSNGDASSDCSLESFVRAMLSLNQV